MKNSEMPNISTCGRKCLAGPATGRFNRIAAHADSRGEVRASIVHHRPHPLCHLGCSRVPVERQPIPAGGASWKGARLPARAAYHARLIDWSGGVSRLIHMRGHACQAEFKDRAGAAGGSTLIFIVSRP